MEDLRNEVREHKVRTLKTFVLCLIFIGLGIYGATPGVTLLDLQILTNTTVGEVANILPARSGGYAVGALISGFVTDYVDHQICLMFALAISTATFAALPYFQSLKVMLTIIFFAGVSAGCIDTVGNVYTIYLWRKKAAFWIQLVHFAFGLGAFISPLIANPFLLEATGEIEQFGEKVAKDYNSFMNMTYDEFRNISHDHEEHRIANFTADDLKVHWAYIIISIFNASVLVFFMIVYCVRPVTKEHPSGSLPTPSELTPEKSNKHDAYIIAEKSTEKSMEMQKSMELQRSVEKSNRINNEKHAPSALPQPIDKFTLIEPLGPWLKGVVVVLSILFFHSYCGLEISFGSLLPTFAVKSNIQMSKSEAAYLTSSYWGMFTFFRIVSLFAITFFSPRSLLIGSMGLIVLSNVFLLPFGNDFRWALWTGSVLMGLGCSSVFATMFAFVEQMTPVTPRFTSMTMIACCLGEFIIPLIVGLFIDQNPEVYLYVIFAYSVLSLIFLAIVFLIQHNLLKKQRAKYAS